MESSPEGYAVSCHYRPAGSGEHGEHTNRYGSLHGTASQCVSNDLDHQRCTVAEVGDVSYFSKKNDLDQLLDSFFHERIGHGAYAATVVCHGRRVRGSYLAEAHMHASMAAACFYGRRTARGLGHRQRQVPPGPQIESSCHGFPSGSSKSPLRIEEKRERGLLGCLRNGRPPELFCSSMGGPFLEDN